MPLRVHVDVLDAQQENHEMRDGKIRSLGGMGALRKETTYKGSILGSWITYTGGAYNHAVQQGNGIRATKSYFH